MGSLLHKMSYASEATALDIVWLTSRRLRRSCSLPGGAAQMPSASGPGARFSRFILREPWAEGARQGAVAPLQGLLPVSPADPGLQPGLGCRAPSGLKTALRATEVSLANNSPAGSPRRLSRR